jgi:hypothetical protein
MRRKNLHGNTLRWLMAGAIALIAGSQAGATTHAPDITSEAAGLHWISTYRAKPEPSQVPTVMRALSKIGAFNEPEKCNAYVGFLAGVIGSHPAEAPNLISETLAMRSRDRWIVVRAIAYSGLPNWKQLLGDVAYRMPERHFMIEKYLTDQLPTLDRLAIKPIPTGFERFRSHFKFGSSSGKKRSKDVLEASPEVLDTLWGYYFATGSYGPVMQMIAMLGWSANKDDADKLTIGSMAKFTLASNATHDQALLDMLRSSSKARNQPKATVVALDEITEAAETVDVASIRKQALAAIADLQRKGPAYKRDVSWWGYIGQSAIAGGCLAAAVVSLTAAGLPCVIGGSSASAAMNFWANQP